MIREYLSEGQWAALLAKKGGTKIYIPKNPGADHPLAQIIGLEALTKLAFYCPGSHNLPLFHYSFERLKTRDKILDLAKSGQGLSTIAHELGVSYRTVYRVVRARR